MQKLRDQGLIKGWDTVERRPGGVLIGSDVEGTGLVVCVLSNNGLIVYSSTAEMDSSVKFVEAPKKE